MGAILVTNFVGLALFLVWFIPLVARPVQRTSGTAPHFPLFAAYLLSCTSAIIALTLWINEAALFLGILLMLAPIAPMLIGFTLLDPVFTEFPVLVGSAFVLTAIFAFLIYKSMGNTRIVLAALAPLLILSFSIFIQAPVTSAKIQTAADNLGGECLAIKPLSRLILDGNLSRLIWDGNRYATLHAVTRKNGQYYNWSYRNSGWQELPFENRGHAPNNACRE